MEKFPILETERLCLSNIKLEDSSEIFELFSDESVIEFYDLEKFTTLGQAQELIKLFINRFESNSGIRWAIRLKGTENLIGTCGFNTWSPKMRNAVIGYELISSSWGKGIATEAVNSIVSAAFQGLLPCGPIHRIQADTVLGNIASEALLLKLGFSEEGIRREAGFWKGKFHNLKCFSLLSSEFKA